MWLKNSDGCVSSPIYERQCRCQLFLRHRSSAVLCPIYFWYGPLCSALRPALLRGPPCSSLLCSAFALLCLALLFLLFSFRSVLLCSPLPCSAPTRSRSCFVRRGAVFVEIGSSEEHWGRADAAGVWANVLTRCEGRRGEPPEGPTRGLGTEQTGHARRCRSFPFFFFAVLCAPSAFVLLLLMLLSSLSLWRLECNIYRALVKSFSSASLKGLQSEWKTTHTWGDGPCTPASLPCFFFGVGGIFIHKRRNAIDRSIRARRVAVRFAAPQREVNAHQHLPTRDQLRFLSQKERGKV